MSAVEEWMERLKAAQFVRFSEVVGGPWDGKEATEEIWREIYRHGAVQVPLPLERQGDCMPMRTCLYNRRMLTVNKGKLILEAVCDRDLSEEAAYEAVWKRLLQKAGLME